MTGSEADEQREAVRKDWVGRSVHWDKRADEVAEPAERLNQPLIEAADIQAGQKVLDLASGAGEPALTIAEIVGETGHITLSDMVPEMLLGAGRRAKKLGITNAAVAIEDMAEMSFEDETFDRVTCRFGIMFCPNKEQAMEETFRVLKPGGKCAWMVWGPKPNNTAFAIIDRTANEVFGADNPLLDVELPFSCSEEGVLEDLVRGAGFETDGEQDVQLNPKLPADQPFWAAMVDMMVGRPRDAASADDRARFDILLKERFERTIKNGRYELSLHTRICTGQKPG